jgi:hypothetical protein
MSSISPVNNYSDLPIKSIVTDHSDINLENISVSSPVRVVHNNRELCNMWQVLYARSENDAPGGCWSDNVLTIRGCEMYANKGIRPVKQDFRYSSPGGDLCLVGIIAPKDPFTSTINKIALHSKPCNVDFASPIKTHSSTNSPCVPLKFTANSLPIFCDVDNNIIKFETVRDVEMKFIPTFRLTFYSSPSHRKLLLKVTHVTVTHIGPIPESDQLFGSISKQISLIPKYKQLMLDDWGCKAIPVELSQRSTDSLQMSTLPDHKSEETSMAKYCRIGAVVCCVLAVGYALGYFDQN